MAAQVSVVLRVRRASCTHPSKGVALQAPRVNGCAEKRKRDRGAHHVVDADPEGEETVRAVPLRPWRLRGEDLVELLHLVDDRPKGQGRAIWVQSHGRMARCLTYRTVGSNGATSAASIVAPPEARLNTFNGGRVNPRPVKDLLLYLGVRHVVCAPCDDAVSVWGA